MPKPTVEQAVASLIDALDLDAKTVERVSVSRVRTVGFTPGWTVKVDQSFRAGVLPTQSEREDKAAGDDGR